MCARERGRELARGCMVCGLLSPLGRVQGRALRSYQPSTDPHQKEEPVLHKVRGVGNSRSKRPFPGKAGRGPCSCSRPRPPAHVGKARPPCWSLGRKWRLRAWEEGLRPPPTLQLSSVRPSVLLPACSIPPDSEMQHHMPQAWERKLQPQIDHVLTAPAPGTALLGLPGQASADPNPESVTRLESWESLPIQGGQVPPQLPKVHFGVWPAGMPSSHAPALH